MITNQTFQSPVALVTGGSGGLGKAICLQLVEAGYRLAIHYKQDVDAAIELAEQIKSQGSDAYILQSDLSKSDSPQRLIEQVLEQAGALDVLVNNAAWDPGAIPLQQTDEAFIDKLFAVNVRAPLMLASRAAAYWIDRHDQQSDYRKPSQATIVNIGSVQARFSLAGHSAYAASKGALDAMTRQMAVELGPHGIRVNAVSPGFIQIPRTMALRTQHQRDRIAERIPLGRLGKPEDVSQIVAMLCSQAGQYINGQIITVDGGSTCQLPTHEHIRPKGMQQHA